MQNNTIIGRVTADIELKKTPSHKSVCNFTIAEKTGKNTVFINLVAWDKTAELLSQYVKKGNQVHLKFYIKNVKKKTREGVEYNSYDFVVNEVTFIEKNDDYSHQRHHHKQEQKNFSTPQNAPSFVNNESNVFEESNSPNLDISNDDLPF